MNSNLWVIYFVSIPGLFANKDINKQTMDGAIANLRSRRKHLDTQNDEEYKREMKKLYKKISAKNRVSVCSESLCVCFELEMLIVFVINCWWNI